MAKLQVWNMVNFERTDYYDVESPKEGFKFIELLSMAQLRNRKITDNAFGLRVFNQEEHEWYEWDDEEGYDISYYKLKDDELVLIDEDEDEEMGVATIDVKYEIIK